MVHTSLNWDREGKPTSYIGTERANRLVILRQRCKHTGYIGTERVNRLVILGQRSKHSGYTGTERVK